MTRQNRVRPDGEIVATPDRGTLMGNRGILHGDDGTLGTSRWTHKTWICCRLDFKARRRELMAPGRYTELFFLDEAVALSAGHRPCGECRRADFTAFRDAWARAHGSLPPVKEMDATLHAARVRSRSRRQITHVARAEGLPHGTMVASDEGPLLLTARGAFAFAGDCYGGRREPPRGEVTVLTPSPTVAVLAAGYVPQLHPSATGAER